MYKLYWHRDTSSTAAMAILEEIGQPYDMQELDWQRGDTETPEYLKFPLWVFSRLSSLAMELQCLNPRQWF
jgi:hypothetical protein